MQSLTEEADKLKTELKAVKTEAADTHQVAGIWYFGNLRLKLLITLAGLFAAVRLIIDLFTSKVRSDFAEWFVRRAGQVKDFAEFIADSTEKSAAMFAQLTDNKAIGAIIVCSIILALLTLIFFLCRKMFRAVRKFRQRYAEICGERLFWKHAVGITIAACCLEICLVFGQFIPFNTMSVWIGLTLMLTLLWNLKEIKAAIRGE